MPVKLTKREISNTFLDPRKDFSPVVHKMEFRYDPLTGKQVRLVHFGAIKPQPLDLDSYKNPRFCPFCFPHRETITPKFLPSIISKGRLSQGEALLVPNISPYDDYSGVVIMSEEHVLSLADLTPERFKDALDLAWDFLLILKEKEPELPYHYIGWNYMPPSGGGLVHPHLQVFASHSPPHRLEMEKAADFMKETGKNFFQEYIATEKERDERYIGQVGESHWLSAFAPVGVLGEYLCIFPDVHTVADLTISRRQDLAAGLLKLRQVFQDRGVFSFNAAFFFGSPGQDSYPLFIRIIPRSFLNTHQYPPDFNFLQTLMQSPFCVTWPEEICREARQVFSEK